MSLRALLRLAGPVVLARASQSLITFADTIQVKHLGYQAIAATATGGLNVLCLLVLGMGTVFIVQSFVAQLAGRGDLEGAPRFAWYGLAVAAIAGAGAAALIPAVAPLLALADYSPAVRDHMTSYMQIRLLSIGAAVGAEALGNWYAGLGNTWMQMVSGIVMMVSAVVLNWLLIDGHCGLPAMGVDGAALASTIATFLGFGFLLVAFLRRCGRPRGLAWRELGRVLRFGAPNGVNWFLDFAAFQLFVNGVLASLGDETVAALNVVIAINSLSAMPGFGLASAGAILAGQAIGRGERDAVWPQVKITLWCTATWMSAIGVLYVAFPDRVLALFASGDTARLVAIGTTMLMLSTAWQLSDAIGMTLGETLRAAGDTTWTAAARLIVGWLVFTPASIVVVRYLGGGPVGALLCLIGYLALLALAFAYRFRSGAWKRIELIEPAPV
jgi:MATE family multidrug resistance protein